MTAGANVGLEAQALWITAPRSAELRSEAVAPPGPGEVRVRTLASAISPGTEMLVYRGEVPAELALDLPTLVGGFGFPIKYGYAAVGRVLDVGPKVEGLRSGDHVFVHHPHQDVFLVSGAMPVRLPEALDPLLGVFVANLETAVTIVHDTPLRLGETAVVFGQGVVGLLVTQLLRLAGAGRVLAVDPLEARRRLSRLVGADTAVEPGEDLPERLRAANSGRGVDVTVEVSGSGGALQNAIDALAVEGTAVVGSWYGGKRISLMLGGNFHRGRVRLRSSQVGRLNPEAAPRWDAARRTELVLNLLPRLRLGELVTHRFPFTGAREAYRLLDERPGEAAQVILTYDGETQGT